MSEIFQVEGVNGAESRSLSLIDDNDVENSPRRAFNRCAYRNISK